MKRAHSILVLTLVASSLFAEAPGWSRGQQLLSITYDECVKRASQSLGSEGYRVDYAAGAFAVGIKGEHTAVIMCNAGPETKQWVNIVVASNGEGGGAERTRLQALMEGAAKSGGGGQPPRAGRYLTVSVNGRHATVSWANAPTSEGAWVSIVPVGTADGSHVGRWAYTDRKSSGTYENGPLDSGAYEARFYGDGGYGLILDRVRFEVGSTAASPAGRILSVQVDGRAALVTWTNAPTEDPRAWVSVVTAGTPDSSHIGKWMYTEGKAYGTYDSGALAPGDYEARFYGDGQYGKLLERVRFHVN